MNSIGKLSNYLSLVASGDAANEIKQYLLALPDDHRYKDRITTAQCLIVDTFMEIANVIGIETGKLEGNVFCLSLDFEKDDGNPDGGGSADNAGRDVSINPQNGT